MPVKNIVEMILKTLLFRIPKTELRLLSSLLACEGLLELAYSHVADVSMKLVKVGPPHQHLFITELSNVAEKLSKVTTGFKLSYFLTSQRKG